MSVSNVTIQKIIAILLSRIKFIIIATVLGGLLFFGYSKFLITPIYSTSTMISIQNSSYDGQINKDNKKIYGSDISGSTTLASICVTLFQNSDELTSLYDGCNVSMSVNSDTFFITISVTGSDPQKCANVANQIADQSEVVFKSYFTYGQISTIREAKVPTVADSPDNVKNGLMGLAAGLIISCVISVLLELVDTTIKVDDDIQSMYGIPVFAEIPDFESQS